MKKHVLAGLTLLSLAACNTPVEEPEIIDENQVIEDQEDQNQYEGTVDYLDKAEELSTTEMVEANRDYYVAAAPEYWSTYEDAEDYPEHMKLYLHAWKTGTFMATDYEGQSLVLVQQECEGPCSGAYFRYAVDEATDTWTLLTDYSSGTEGWAAGPMDASDSTVEIPELDVPQSLEGYQNDSVALLNEYSRLYTDQFAEADFIPNMDGLTKLTGFADDSFPSYYQAEGCIYGVTPDGVMARYTLVPNEFMATTKAGDFDQAAFESQELTFTDMDGNSETRTYALFAGGCGLGWSCLDTYELSSEEEARLEQVGTLDGRAVYLPTSVGEEPALDADYSLDKRLWNAYSDMLLAKAYDLGMDPTEYGAENNQSIEDYLATNATLLIKLDNGSYITTNLTEYAPMAECGKPVIYLYPEKNTVVRVQVGIDEFTKTIPDYGTNGWTVLARANGLLTNLADQLDYPYLFWEGNTDEAVMADGSWTLAKDEVAERLPEALKGMGLNDQETADFMEFWLPKLEAVNEDYVEFAFVDETVMDQIAPLTVKPYPDQIIRLFMYYRGTDEAGAAMPSYKPETRYGFTLVEWGGTLY